MHKKMSCIFKTLTALSSFVLIVSNLSRELPKENHTHANSEDHKGGEISKINFVQDARLISLLPNKGIKYSKVTVA